MFPFLIHHLRLPLLKYFFYLNRYNYFICAFYWMCCLEEEVELQIDLKS
jgi:hypothetical protein